MANLLHPRKISAVFQGSSFQGQTINIIQQKPDYNQKELLKMILPQQCFGVLYFNNNCSIVRIYKLSTVFLKCMLCVGTVIAAIINLIIQC